MDGGSLHVWCNMLEQYHGLWQIAGQGKEIVFAPEGKEKVPVKVGIDVRLAYWLLGKLVEGLTPHHPFDKLS